MYIQVLLFIDTLSLQRVPQQWPGELGRWEMSHGLASDILKVVSGSER